MSETQTLEKAGFVSVLIYLLFKGRSRIPATYEMELMVIVEIASSCWLLSQRALFCDGVRVLDSPMPLARRVEQKPPYMVNNRSHG